MHTLPVHITLFYGNVLHLLYILFFTYYYHKYQTFLSALCVVKFATKSIFRIQWRASFNHLPVHKRWQA